METAQDKPKNRIDLKKVISFRVSEYQYNILTDFIKKSESNKSALFRKIAKELIKPE